MSEIRSFLAVAADERRRRELVEAEELSIEQQRAKVEQLWQRIEALDRAHNRLTTMSERALREWREADAGLRRMVAATAYGPPQGGVQ